MSRRSAKRAPEPNAPQALLFAALGNRTRLALIAKLGAGRPSSIAQLTAGTRLTRQAVTKHLRALQRAGIVRSARAGRERRFVLELQPIEEMQAYLERVSRQWDRALLRLKAFVED